MKSPVQWMFLHLKKLTAFLLKSESKDENHSFYIGSHCNLFILVHTVTILYWFTL